MNDVKKQRRIKRLRKAELRSKARRALNVERAMESMARMDRLLAARIKEDESERGR